MKDHAWYECEPAILAPPDASPEDTQHMIESIQTVWVDLPTEARQAFHRLCCHNSRDPEDLTAVHRIYLLIEAQANRAKGER